MMSSATLGLWALLLLSQFYSTSGILHGPGYAFTLVAPPGWVFDDKSGADDGLPAVFYRDGETWPSAKVVMYAKVSALERGQLLDQGIAAAIRRLKRTNPSLEVETAPPIPRVLGGTFQVRVFRGTWGGATEYVAYSAEGAWVVQLVLSGSSELISDAYGSYLQLLKTYAFFSDRVQE